MHVSNSSNTIKNSIWFGSVLVAILYGSEKKHIENK